MHVYFIFYYVMVKQKFANFDASYCASHLSIQFCQHLF